ncbi:DUF3574 domain-containing protein [Aggregicoccus sp. 17bor-14]|uniref:DUF3574 domain-containing protein n=1 Tax=Myxococcaceae TaxID=31 RepID=UPI00129C4EBC|nr:MULTISPECIES: DUF3574 domain-containing protein [Myxococcaceae]MBF5041971.1 DUF3574 domain-containing protein [Simulacricoccus sp. 17bor-14]MRI87752.1 DUF3574 domain-containing protein [Aggregicoccus sp. 17bor-14]
MSPRALCLALSLLLSSAVVGCASGARTLPGATAGVVERLYFGRTFPGGEVSDADWAAFLRDEVTPRFPAGLTAWPTQGQWRDTATGEVTREPGFVLELLHPAQEDAAQRVEGLCEAYRARFHQKAVLWMRSEVQWREVAAPAVAPPAATVPQSRGAPALVP